MKTNLKDAIISIEISEGVSKKNGKPYTAGVILFKANNGALITKRIFFQDYEKPLLDIA